LRPLTKQHKDLIKPPAVLLERTNIELRRLMAPWPFYRAEKLALAVEETSAREEARGCYPAAFEEFNPPFLRTAHPPGGADQTNRKRADFSASRARCQI
jgi:hypothetical protein